MKFLMAVFTWLYSGWSPRLDKARKECGTPRLPRNYGSLVVPASLSLYHHQIAVLSSEPGHSMSHPEAWYQTKAKELPLLLISTTCVFVTPLQPQMIFCVLLRIFWKACITKAHVLLNRRANPFVFVWYQASGWDT